MEEQELKILELKDLNKKLTVQIMEQQKLYENYIETKIVVQDNKNTILMIIFCIMIAINKYGSICW